MIKNDHKKRVLHESEISTIFNNVRHGPYKKKDYVPKAASLLDENGKARPRGYYFTFSALAKPKRPVHGWQGPYDSRALALEAAKTYLE